MPKEAKMPIVHTTPRDSVDLEKKLQLAKTESSGLHLAVRLTFFVGRVMGIVPLVGLLNQKSDKLKFQLRSPYAIFYYISVVGQALMSIMSFYWLLESKISLGNTSNCLFYTSGALSFIILTNVTKRWPTLIMSVEALENHLPPLSSKVSKHCNITTTIILLAALVEHLFSIFFGITVAKACDPNNIVETFFHYDKPWIFTYTTYTLWKGILIEVFNIQATFIWSYNDLLIMLISIYLTEHFHTHNKLLKNAFRQDHYDCSQFRKQHLMLVKLLRMINDTIGIYIVTCFGCNLYWICTQLFYCVNKSYTGHFISCELKEDAYNPADGIEHTIYFAYSFTFLVIRTMMVLLFAARVHTASEKPLFYLYQIPSSKFNVDVERFIGQITHIKVALSGLGFFYVTRTMILTLLGTIVTYELVLLQFNN